MSDRRSFWFLPLIGLFALQAGCGKSVPANTKKVIVLGIDGMDPDFVEQHWSSLPNLARLRAMGSFHRLQTTTPPQSPVAWSTFITGLTPAVHGIFDFVHRDPATLQPFSSMSKTQEPWLTLPIGPYRLPLASSRVVSLRKGRAFWEILAEHGVPVTIIRMPTNYPPIEVGQAIAGMGTPDLQGTQGTFAFYTDDPEELDRSVPGGRIFKTSLKNGHAVLSIPGPPNSLRTDKSIATATLTVDVDPEQPLARVAAGDQVSILREGEWSDWVRIDFTLVPHLASTRGIVRVFAKQMHPRFQLYLSPINIDPLAPVLPVSAPISLSQSVAEETGRFFTLGIPEDSAALRQGVFNLPQFLSQTHLVFEDERKLLRYALRNFRYGLLFYYFSTVDENSHMLWGKHESELLNVYREVDALVGEAMRAVPDAHFIVMSDHGFTTFDRAVNLNTWLYQSGFLALIGSPGGDANIRGAEWSRTAAYALGLNGLYLNLSGREKYGVINPGAQRDSILSKLRDKLLAFRDPVNGKQVVEAVDASNPDRSNAHIAPDLIVGYARGYRASWQTGLGGVPSALIDDNTDAWIGDHCINPADVPGVLFTNRSAANSRPQLEDVTFLVLRAFGLSSTAGVSGAPI